MTGANAKRLAAEHRLAAALVAEPAAAFDRLTFHLDAREIELDARLAEVEKRIASHD